MSKSHPDRVETLTVVFADPAPAAKELRSLYHASTSQTDDRTDTTDTVADLRAALANDPAVSAVALIAPIDALLEKVSIGCEAKQAVQQVRAELRALTACIRQYRPRLTLMDLSFVSTETPGLAGALGLPRDALDSVTLPGDQDPVLRALAAQALAEDPAFRDDLDFLAASSALPPDADLPMTADKALSTYLSLRETAAGADALRTELSRRDATGKLAERQIQAMTKEFGVLESQVKTARTRAKAAEEEISSLRARLEQSEACVAEGACREEELSWKLANLERRIQSLRGTLTVRFTKPFRRLGRAFRRVGHG